MALSAAAREAIWIRQLLVDLGFARTSPIKIRGDNKGCIVLAEHPSSHGRTKHIAVHYHKTREAVADEEVVLEWIPTDYMAADILTKPLGSAKHYTFVKMLGLVHLGIEGASWVEEARRANRECTSLVL